MDTKLLLDNISKHIQLNQSEIDYFLSILNPKELKRKEVLLAEGDIARTTNFITAGCLKVYEVDKEGTEHIAVFAVEGWWMSDLHSFLTQTPARSTVAAIEETSLIQITKNDLETLYINVPKFERYFRILHQNAFVSQADRIMQNMSLTAEERYEKFIAKYPQLEQRISQKQIASFLGITPEFLSIIRRRRMQK